jgi:hypothetical protein
MSDYAEYVVSGRYEPWRYGEYPNEPAWMTRAGYRELLRCVWL